MAVIVIAVVTQGFRVPQDSRGDVKNLLLLNTGFFQAVGVISFGMPSCHPYTFQNPVLIMLSICLPYVVIPDSTQTTDFAQDHNSLLIYGSLKKPTLDRFAKVTHYSTGISLLMCLLMGVSGFLFFGSETQGNVLNNFPSDNILINIARL
jgi:sodium-coupled neutral amino acid transporter 11